MATNFNLDQLIFYITDEGYVRSARVIEIVKDETGIVRGYVAKTKHGIVVDTNSTFFYDKKQPAYLHIQANALRWIEIHTKELRRWRTMRDRADDALSRLGDD